MAEALKDKFFNILKVNELANNIKTVYTSFKSEEFIKWLFDKVWEKAELKERIRKISLKLN